MPDREHVAEIAAAYLKRNVLAADQLPTLIETVHAALAAAESGGSAGPAKELVPAVPVRRSVLPDAIVCLDCGRRQKILKLTAKNTCATNPMTPGIEP